MRLLEEFDFRIDYLLLFFEFWSIFLLIIFVDGLLNVLLLISDVSLLSNFVSYETLSIFLSFRLVIEVSTMLTLLFFLLTKNDDCLVFLVKG